MRKAGRAAGFLVAMIVGTCALASAGPFEVSNLADSGAGSLRQAVLDANATSGTDDIIFAPGLQGTIPLTSGEILIADSVNIVGPGARTLAISSNARIFTVNDPMKTADVVISGLTLTGANATGNGGAIANTGPETLTLSFVALTDNQTTGEGGALFNPGGVVTIENSTVSGNKATKAGAIYSIGFQLILRNSTVFNNQASDSVGGIKLEFGFGTFTNSTISGNRAAFSQGGILAGTGNQQLDLVSTIVSGNTDTTGASDLARFSGFVNASNSLIEQNLMAGVINGTDTANLIGVDPALRPLANNGGPTDTLAITVTSPAHDAGSNPENLVSDQRGPGFPRQVGLAVDIGAYEFRSSAGAPALSPLVLLGLAAGLLALGMRSRRFRRPG